jgi:hypothetical protein
VFSATYWFIDNSRRSHLVSIALRDGIREIRDHKQGTDCGIWTLHRRSDYVPVLFCFA